MDEFCSRPASETRTPFRTRAVAADLAVYIEDRTGIRRRSVLVLRSELIGLSEGLCFAVPEALAVNDSRRGGDRETVSDSRRWHGSRQACLEIG